jgi:hypothetical protein
MLGDSVPATCSLAEPGDGLVPTISARYTSQKYVGANETYETLDGEQRVFMQVRQWLALSPKTNFAAGN